MKNNIVALIVFAFIAMFVISCGTTPTPTPMPTQAPVQVTVIVTATLPPPTATSALPTLTAIPTVALTTTLATVTPIAIAQATKAPVTVKPAATRTPTVVVPAASPTPSALPMKFGAPVLTSPIWSNKDERRWDADDLVFRWRPVGGLQGDECYLLSLSSEAVNPGPGVGTGSDYFVTNCGNGSGTADKDISFTLFSPKRGGPNYSSIKLNTDMWVHWSITVVKTTGACDAGNPYHCKYAPISPKNTDYFRFIGS